MSRAWQEFVAPGEEDEPLPIGGSPWHRGRWVRIPKEHWDLLLTFAAKLDKVGAAKLRALSWAADENEMDYIHSSREELESLAKFIDALKGELARVPPLVPEATENIPDRYTNEEHTRMLQAVEAVLLEAARLGQPFRAWSE